MSYAQQLKQMKADIKAISATVEEHRAAIEAINDKIKGQPVALLDEIELNSWQEARTQTGLVEHIGPAKPSHWALMAVLVCVLAYTSIGFARLANQAKVNTLTHQQGVTQ